MKKKVSVREIAEICNVSTATVSRALNNSDDVSEEKKSNILAVAQKLGYKKANNLIQRKKLIGVLHPYIGIPHLTNIESDLEKILKENDYDIIYTSYHLNNIDYKIAIKQTIDLFQRNNVDAIILFLTDVFDIELDMQIPIIYAYLESDDFHNKQISISYDLYIGGKLAAYELLKNNATNPLILYNSHFSHSANQRYKGFIDGFQENGYIIDNNHRLLANPNKKTFQDAYDIVQYLFMKGIQFDSIYAGSDWRAFGALSALQDLSVKVPDEVKIIGFDGSEIAKHNFIPITSVEMNSYLFAYQTYQLLNKLINNIPVSEKNIVVPVQLFIGRST